LKRDEVRVMAKKKRPSVQATLPRPRPRGTIIYDNQGRVVVVSGGASGIGSGIVTGFRDSGAAVVSLDVSHKKNRESAGILELQCDVSKEEDCERSVASIAERFGGIDVLVNNAAIQPPESYVRPDEVQREMWERMVAVNLTGYMMLAKHVLRVMRQQGSGVIVNMASGQAHRTARDVPMYGPLKAANRLQAMQWGVQYAREGIRVVSVSPGAIDTPLVRASLEQQGGAANLANRHPLGRLGKPEEVAHAVMWLSSADAAFITATDLEVDGGLGGLGSFADPYPIATVKVP